MNLAYITVKRFGKDVQRKKLICLPDELQYYKTRIDKLERFLLQELSFLEELGLYNLGNDLQEALGDIIIGEEEPRR